MNKHILVVLFTLPGLTLYAQQPEKKSLLKSWPISVTPLSFWDSDISTSAGTEYRFHPSFSFRVAVDYIYGDYSYERTVTTGLRVRQELRYYIAGNRLINSRSGVWPYISISHGNKWVTTRFSDWYFFYENNQGYQKWQTYRSQNKEWYIMGRTGMQSAFGRQKRFLFDISAGVGVSNDKVSFSFPEGDNMRAQVLADYSNSEFENASHNKYSGRFTAVNFEACFGYRLLR